MSKGASNRPRQRGRGLRFGLYLYLILALLLPLITLVFVAFTNQPINPLNALLAGKPQLVADLLRQFSVDPLLEVFKTARYRQALGNSMALSLTVACLATLLGTLVAFAGMKPGVPGRKAWWVLSAFPLAIPPFLGSIGLKLLAGRGGVLQHILAPMGIDWPADSVYSYGGVIMVQVFTLFPFVALQVRAAFQRLDNALGEAAFTLGGTPSLVLWTVTLPLLLPSLGAGFLLVFMRSFGDFGTPLILLPPSKKLLILEAYKDLTGGLFWAEAAIQSIAIILVVVAAMALERRILKGRDYHSLGHRAGSGGDGSVFGEFRRSVKPGEKQRSSLGERLLALVTGLIFAVPVLLILAMLLLALTASWGDQALPDAITLLNLSRVTIASPRPLVITLVGSVLTIVVSLALGAMGAYLFRRLPAKGDGLLEFTLNLPMVLPGIALGIGMIAAFNAPPMAFHPSAFLLLLSYVLTRTPYGLESVGAALHQLPVSLEEASATLGGTPGFTQRHVLAPLLGPALSSASVFIYFSVAHDISLTLLLAPTKFIPASISLYHELDSGRLYLAAAYGVVLFLVTVIPYIWQTLRQAKIEGTH